MAPHDEKAAVLRWLRGQQAAARRKLELLATEGPDPVQAVAEQRAALRSLAAMGMWPGPRDAVSERAVQEVRRRWVRIQQRARQAHKTNLH